MSTTDQPLLSLCMIVRDSARTLAACLESIRPWVDEIVVVDTGSLDETRDIARRFGARVSDFPWIDDFSAARNESFRLATGQWLLWMDADDTIEVTCGQQLRALVRGLLDPHLLGCVMQVHCPGGADDDADNVTVVDHVKLVRNHPEIRFEGRIHEQLLPAIHRLGGHVAWTDLFVVHSGADHSEAGKRRKCERDLHILQLDLQDRPDHPFVLFNLGMTFAEMGDHAIAEEWLRRCLAVSRDHESHVRKAYALLVSCLKEQRRQQEARDVCARGLALYPQDVELLFRHGMLAHEAEQLGEAIGAYRAALAPTEARHFSSIDRGLFGHKTKNNLALAYADAGQHALAETLWRSITDGHPQIRSAWRGLGQALVQQKKWTALDLLLDDMESHAEQRADACWLRAQSALHQGGLSGVRPMLEEALAFDASHLPARQDLCRWHFDQGTLEDAEASLRELTRLRPRDGAAFHNLGLVYARMGKIPLGREAFEQSLRVRPESGITREELRRLESGLPASTGNGNETSRRTNSLNGHKHNGHSSPLDIVYTFRHSPHQDLEILFSLRSVAKHLPYVRKVWIFGDRPAFLSDDTSIVEHISEDSLAVPLGYRVPVCNDFLLLFLASLIPELAMDFVQFSDDYIVLADLSRERLCIPRVLEDLTQISVRGRGAFKDLLWSTYDTLQRLGYPGYNFEGHVPQPYTRRLVLDAFATFRDFVSEDKFFGLIAGTSIANFALRRDGSPFVWQEEEQSKVGFYKSCPSTEEIASACDGRVFLNFSDQAFADPMVRFLEARFPDHCQYEGHYTAPHGRYDDHI